MDPRDGEVRERLGRYLDVVEAWGLCPWAASARRDGVVQVEVVWDREPGDRVAATARAWAEQADFRIGLIVVPDAGLDPAAMRRLRDRIAAACPAIAIADFHPDGGDPTRPLDAARLVPLLRRSPEPMLQIVPQAALVGIAAPPPAAAGPTQAAMLAGAPVAATRDPRSQIADVNLATVRERGVERLLAELAELRALRA